jgi:hypothetical protein
VWAYISGDDIQCFAVFSFGITLSGVTFSM